MVTNDIIAIIILVVVVFAIAYYFFFVRDDKKHRLKEIVQKHGNLVATLLDREKCPDVSILSESQIALILSLSDEEWSEWEYLLQRANNIVQLYPFALYDYIGTYMPKVKERKRFKEKVARFAATPVRAKTAINAMLIDELRTIDADSEETWKRRDKSRVAAANIKKKYPDGYTLYLTLHRPHTPDNSEVIRDENNIRELQQLHTICKAYEGFEKKQGDFCSIFWQLLKDGRSQDGRYTYQVKFNKPTLNGKLTESEFKIWQGFCESFSSFLLDKQTDNFKIRYNRISAFKNRTRYFNDHVYDGITSIISAFQEKVSGEIYVCFINRCKRNWAQISYDYHFDKLKERLVGIETPSFEITELPTIQDNGDIAGIFIYDFITSNDELMNNCRLIIEHFSKSVPLLGYYSMLKEYDEEELLELAEKNDDYLKSDEFTPEEDDDEEEDLPFGDYDEPEYEESEADGIAFIKQAILDVKKHSFFSYVAIPNTWAGEAGQAESTKATWLSNPSKYHFKLLDTNGTIECEYSTDGQRHYKKFSVEGDNFDIDDVAYFTYHLFKTMGIYDEFKSKGHLAVGYMNSKHILEYH